MKHPFWRANAPEILLAVAVCLPALITLLYRLMH